MKKIIFSALLILSSAAIAGYEDADRDSLEKAVAVFEKQSVYFAAQYPAATSNQRKCVLLINYLGVASTAHGEAMYFGMYYPDLFTSSGMKAAAEAMNEVADKTLMEIRAVGCALD
ncbi:hypothetical protein [Candidatus Spongiihabitans sp.]|uniref:hypothetical protein n=1 Tax=Candidatus Spongiihabitans sp. TaxID=3101308 RepID=UPI003C7D355B